MDVPFSNSLHVVDIIIYSHFEIFQTPVILWGIIRISVLTRKGHYKFTLWIPTKCTMISIINRPKATSL